VLNEEARVKTVSPEEAAALAAKGATMVDVRYAPDVELWRVEGWVSVPYWAAGGLWGFLAPLRFPGSRVRNDAFVSAALAALPSNKRAPVVLGCIWGGSLEEAPPPKGIDGTRGNGSLHAAYELHQLGFTNLHHLRGGFNNYYEDSFFAPDAIPRGRGQWPGDLELFGYRQFKGKDVRRGRREV